MDKHKKNTRNEDSSRTKNRDQVLIRSRLCCQMFNLPIHYVVNENHAQYFALCPPVPPCLWQRRPLFDVGIVRGSLL